MNTLIIALGSLIAGVVIALVVSYFLPKEKIRTANQAIEKEEQDTKLRIKDLEKQYLEKEKELNNQLNELQLQNNQLHTQIQQSKDDWEKEKSKATIELIQKTQQLELEVRGLEERRNSIIQTLEKEAQESGRIFKDQQIQIAKEQVEKAKIELNNSYDEAAEQAKKAYLSLLAESSQEYKIQLDEIDKQLIQARTDLEQARLKANAIIEVNKRAELEREKQDFYRLQLSDIDIEEIARIRSIEPYLRQKEPLNKVIWKVYYEKPYTDLIGRVIGIGRHSGIYKITSLQTGMCYIGQAVDLAERWKQHAKRGVGADPPTQNKLYPAMLEQGVENFTFEIVEECPVTQLSEREKYYTDVFQAQAYGYTIRKG